MTTKSNRSTSTDFTGDKLTVTNTRDYKRSVPHTVNTNPEFIQIWSNPTEVWDYDQLSVTVDEDEVLVQEQNLTVGQGRYIAISEDVIESLLEDTILEN